MSCIEKIIVFLLDLKTIFQTESEFSVLHSQSVGIFSRALLQEKFLVYSKAPKLLSKSSALVTCVHTWTVQIMRFFNQNNLQKFSLLLLTKCRIFELK